MDAEKSAKNSSLKAPVAWRIT
uniref:PER1 n=1 Tax=Arundo donax TaxID=35708 RepID=A0A0A9F7M3_ARUDO